jgi:BirA family biotin operon repressor/biotin-[acetyl-CoA-carboxylase] ligase
MVQSKENSCFLVIGIGINANQLAGQFPEDLKKIATSLRIINGSPTNRLDVIQSLLKNIDREYHGFLTDGGNSVIKKWGLHSNLFGKMVSIKHGSTITTGTAMRIDSLGRLVLLLDNQHEKAFDSGEVSLHKN